jgi:pimeloyl-[acyl-carrier protein] synthase
LIAAPPLTRKQQAQFSLLQLLKPQVLADPYPLYARLREFEPVHWDPFLHAWVVTTYAEVVSVLTRFKAERTPSPERMAAMGLAALGPYAELMQRQLLFLDAPDHTRIRAVCAAAFTPKRIALLGEAIQQIADTLIDRVLPTGEMDVVAEFAGLLPAHIITALLGLPETNLDQLRHWAADFGELVGNFEHDPDRVEPLARSLAEFKLYITQQVVAQQTAPRAGLIATLLAADAEQEANPQRAALSLDEIVANSLLVIGGGLEELSNLIANGLFSLLSRPEQHRQLTANPELMPSAVEELLRFESTTQYTSRIAPEDALLGGTQLRKGDAVIAVLAAANRDPARFPSPNQLELTRADNRHVAFSWAAHYCLGAPLVRMSANIAFTTILQRLSGLTLVTTEPKWRGMAAMRSIQSLHVRFQPTGPVSYTN